MVRESEQKDQPPSRSVGMAVFSPQGRLPSGITERIGVLQVLESQRDRSDYVPLRRTAADKLGISDRQLRRLQRQYRESGGQGLTRQVRSDRGQSKISDRWHSFILQSYRDGNKGQRQTSRAQVAKQVESRAAELGERDYPSRQSVYRILAAEIVLAEHQRHRRSIGWQGETLKLRTKEGIELDIEYSNQVWQCDHTRADIMVVDGQGDPLGCPTLTTVIDTYSRCIMGIRLGLDYPSAAVTCLALRHAILPKQHSHAYEPKHLWESYGVPQYLYTDAGKDFTSTHIDQVANSLGIVLCLRRRPSDGGIVERPFGTLNTEFFSMLPGYTTRLLKGHQRAVEADARLTLEQLEGLLIRYITDNYNQQPDARTGKESRMKRWQSNLMAQAPALEDRELDLLLMRQGHRRIYRGGYIRFANLLYKGEYLEGFVGQQVVLRYNPRDITSLYVYRAEGERDIFLTRAHAQNLETERLSLPEAKAISRRLRQARQEITNVSVLTEIRDRTSFIADLLSAKSSPSTLLTPTFSSSSAIAQPSTNAPTSDVEEEEDEYFDPPAELVEVPPVRVFDYDKLRHEYGNAIHPSS